METPNIFKKYNWQFGIVAHRTLADIGTFADAVVVEQALAHGRTLNYFQTPKGLLVVSWDKPRCQ